MICIVCLKETHHSKEQIHWGCASRMDRDKQFRERLQGVKRIAFSYCNVM